MKNLEISEIFYKMADILEMEGVEWKPRAYRKAARSIETMAKDITDIYEKNGIKGLEDIPGVGRRMAEKIEEYIKTNKIKEFERLKRKLPSGLDEVMNIPGMGPKKAIKLYKTLRIKDIKDLAKAAKTGKIKSLEGFGEKSEQDILRGIALKEQNKGRMLLGKALDIARSLKKQIEKTGLVTRAEIAGSIRRRKETVGDIDLLAISDKPKEVMEAFVKLPEVKTILVKGPTKSSVIISPGIQADLRVLQKETFGSGLQYFTGSKDHNIELRRIAIKKGYKLSEYGLFKGKIRIAGRTEEEIYKNLGMQYIPPELRTNRGEIEAAQKKRLPRLINYTDIKGDLQMHTQWSDGSNTIEEMARTAKKMGYSYIAITDHSKSEHVARGMDEKKLSQYIKAITKAQEKVKGIKILKGAEVDILSDGSMDYDDKTLKKLDIVLAAVHSGFKMSKTEMTKRIIAAIENKHVNILAHPTGRIIGKRQPYQTDMTKIIESAKENKVALEIDAYPSRLDMNDENARIAAEKGVMIAIDTDAHQASQLRYMELGVAVARRAWIRKEQVINTKTYAQLLKFLSKR
ncbi:MAG TPA: DNA polymerase/3'-5' exonuclease PolX [Candidatus Woesearchaeota archaeon]|nr:MAG: DNA polymerase/3'-5' exonuclease PolX [Candidatus Woesearchaeota archaeon]HDD70617.1 DNA polymerase/3'-5' exonuclease PolX [Candidatus Woesearchaeota archaeon]